VIDAGGGVRYWLAPGQAARADGFVPAARAPTWFARMGNALSLLGAAVVFVSGLVAMRAKRR
jgi:apolipoprotein N-acyltransferase